ncbi:hypothetical protein Rs2_05807 [Raphanus sativus]|uniref:Uncharacterized protein LOC108824321 n=1 Tax=Raphanus sativus TaxID=3726 RepID=A0A6J0L0Q0_RAPSA|nr:uncharacterized protein LOC108824321 [Raphanus sativus]KAJ4911186.1 hypothetical protein Rs2_05807 [Raphanus sativus]
MPKTLATEPSRNNINPALLALTPRQVLISRPVIMGKESKALSLKSEQKSLLLRSIAQYLDRCGFSKCFKKLLSEAEIEKKELDSALPDLEEVYGVFLNTSNLEAVEEKDEVEKNASDDQKKEAAEEVKKEKKKKKVEVTKEEKVKETDGEIGDGIKEKKKNKKEPKVEVAKEEKVKETDGEVEDGVKEKEKKKKKKTKSKAAESETLGDEERVSKKRKRSEPEEETKEQTDDDDEDSKRRKKEDMDVQETPVKQTDVEENGNVETKSTNKKSGKGLSDSKEPKKPFQRVNVEEVVFTDDRLKDNSYWAKGGADSGYGAKAQEVLGQVRGRGFRHEKTKKKRGSYRGGEIDLQSHSVKFEYSDDE